MHAINFIHKNECLDIMVLLVLQGCVWWYRNTSRYCHCPHHSWMCHSKKGEPQKDQVSTLDDHCTAARWVQCYHDHGVVMGKVEYLTIVVIYQFTSHT